MENLKLFEGNAYLFNDDSLGIYMCDIYNRPNEIYIAEINDKTSDPSQYIDIRLTDKAVCKNSFKIVDRHSIKIPFYYKQKQVKVTFHEYIELSNNLIGELYNDISKYCENISTSRDSREYKVTEDIIKTILYHKEYLDMKSFHSQMNTIRNFQIYFANLGGSIGCELDKIRPVVIWRSHITAGNRDQNTFFVFPLTSKIKGSKYYYNVPIEVNGKKNLIKINDGRRISIDRIISPLLDKNTNKILKLSEEDISNIIDAISEYLIKPINKKAPQPQI